MNIKRIKLTRFSNDNVTERRCIKIYDATNQNTYKNNILFVVTIIRTEISTFDEGITVTALNVPLFSIN